MLQTDRQTKCVDSRAYQTYMYPILKIMQANKLVQEQETVWERVVWVIGAMSTARPASDRTTTTMAGAIKNKRKFVRKSTNASCYHQGQRSPVTFPQEWLVKKIWIICWGTFTESSVKEMCTFVGSNIQRTLKCGLHQHSILTSLKENTEIIHEAGWDNLPSAITKCQRSGL